MMQLLETLLYICTNCSGNIELVSVIKQEITAISATVGKILGIYIFKIGL